MCRQLALLSCYHRCYRCYSKSEKPMPLHLLLSELARVCYSTCRNGACLSMLVSPNLRPHSSSASIPDCSSPLLLSIHLATRISRAAGQHRLFHAVKPVSPRALQSAHPKGRFVPICRGKGRDGPIWEIGLRRKRRSELSGRFRVDAFAALVVIEEGGMNVRGKEENLRRDKTTVGQVGCSRSS